MAAENGPSVFSVEVAHARPDRQVLLSLEVCEGTTAAEAIEQSGIREQFPDLRVEPGLVGIFSRKVELDQILRAGDRVEVYRPLIADPKESRRERASRSKAR
jgi:putative ubiquitin-RnfH superfamily antitoxin RatB of RatAB toxin-antitoxin module